MSIPTGQVASMSRPSNMPLQEKTTHGENLTKRIANFKALFEKIGEITMYVYIVVETTSAPMTPAATPTSSQELQRLCDAYVCNAIYICRWFCNTQHVLHIPARKISSAKHMPRGRGRLLVQRYNQAAHRGPQVARPYC